MHVAMPVCPFMLNKLKQQACLFPGPLPFTFLLSLLECLFPCIIKQTSSALLLEPCLKASNGLSTSFCLKQHFLPIIAIHVLTHPLRVHPLWEMMSVSLSLAFYWTFRLPCHVRVTSVKWSLIVSQYTEWVDIKLEPAGNHEALKGQVTGCGLSSQGFGFCFHVCLFASGKAL